MARIQVNLSMCLLLLLLSHSMQVQPESSNLISLGSSLHPNTNLSCWFSPSRHFAFGFYPQGDGFAVGIWLVNNRDDPPEGNHISVVWTAYRDDPPLSSNSTIEFNKDGQLILRTGQAEELKYISDPYWYEGPGFSALMLDSGNFVICNKSSEVIWESFDSPTDTLLGGQSITYYSGGLTSSRSTSDHSSGLFLLQMTADERDLVACPRIHTDDARAPEEIYWKIKINTGAPYVYSTALNLTTAGVLQLTRNINETIQVIANVSYNSVMNETVIYRATFDADGILRLYLHHFKIHGSSNVTLVWSALQNRCQVKGFCGFNSYCSNASTGADCFCFPGFDYINPQMRTGGCSRNFFDEDDCERKDPATFYNVTVMENTMLGGMPYTLLSVNKEGCRKSCLEDCYCGAAFYVNGTCRKLKLPLMFGMKGENESGLVFIKWSSTNGSHIFPPPPAPPIPSQITVVVENKKKLITILAAILGSITFLCFLIAIYSFVVYKHRVAKYRKLPAHSKLGLKEEFTTLKSFSYNELEQATVGFKEQLGRGSFGAVYKGTINEGKKMVAVKLFQNLGEEGERKFRAEMAAVRRTHHRNLVRLLGFCIESSRKLLVYEYMSKGSLADHLFHVENRPPWKERLRFALDVAKGILYLHEECEVQIIHCNIKPKNILIDGFGTAKVSNFGLANLLMPIQTETISRVKGTKGYMAPEWQHNDKISVKSDVYNFGILLLEIACCRSNIQVTVETPDEILLSTWVYKCLMEGELNKLVQDQEEVDMKILERLLKVGLLCVPDDQSLRPSMKSVILMLEGTMDVPLPSFSTTLVT